MFRKLLTLSAFALLCLDAQAANYRLYYHLNTHVPAGSGAESGETDSWSNRGTTYSCTNWSPAASTIANGLEFTQTATDCLQDQIRTVNGVEEQRTVTATETRQQVGILEAWIAYEPEVTNWKIDRITGCVWTPDAKTVTENKEFTQTSDTCSIEQYRYTQDREINTATKEIRYVGEEYEEDQTLTNQHMERPYSVSFTEWVDTVFLKDCTNWAPAADTINKGVTFDQTATDCKREQNRTRSESYYDARINYTVKLQPVKEVRYKENQSMTMPRVGTKPFTECKFSIADRYYVLDEYNAPVAKRTMLWGSLQPYWNTQWFNNASEVNWSGFSSSVDYSGFLYYIGTNQGNGYYSICRE